MRTILFAVSTAAALLTSAPLLSGAASAASLQLAQVDIRVGPPAVMIEEERRPGVVIEERRRPGPGVVIEGTDGRLKQRPFLEPIITSTLQALVTEEVTARLERAGIANGRVNDLEAVWRHPQLEARERWREVETPAGKMPALLPNDIDNFEPRMDAVPALGEHTKSVLKEIGLSEIEIAEFDRP